jgi:hypothetical protein
MPNAEFQPETPLSGDVSVEEVPIRLERPKRALSRGGRATIGPRGDSRRETLIAEQQRGRRPRDACWDVRQIEPAMPVERPVESTSGDAYADAGG